MSDSQNTGGQGSSETIVTAKKNMPSVISLLKSSETNNSIRRPEVETSTQETNYFGTDSSFTSSSDTTKTATSSPHGHKSPLTEIASTCAIYTAPILQTKSPEVSIGDSQSHDVSSIGEASLSPHPNGSDPNSTLERSSASKIVTITRVKSPGKINTQSNGTQVQHDSVAAPLFKSLSVESLATSTKSKNLFQASVTVQPTAMYEETTFKTHNSTNSVKKEGKLLETETQSETTDPRQLFEGTTATSSTPTSKSNVARSTSIFGGLSNKPTVNADISGQTTVTSEENKNEFRHASGSTVENNNIFGQTATTGEKSVFGCASGCKVNNKSIFGQTIAIGENAIFGHGSNNTGGNKDVDAPATTAASLCGQTICSSVPAPGSPFNQPTSPLQSTTTTSSPCLEPTGFGRKPPFVSSGVSSLGQRRGFGSSGGPLFREGHSGRFIGAPLVFKSSQSVKGFQIQQPSASRGGFSTRRLPVGSFLNCHHLITSPTEFHCHLWMGYVEPYMTEVFIMSAFQRMGEKPLNAKVMRNRITGELCGYCFIHFETDNEAIKAMHKLNGKFIPNTNPRTRFHLNITSSSSGADTTDRDDLLWVGNLSPDVGDYQLYRTFASRYESIRTATVLRDNTGRSKGHGLIQLISRYEQEHCMSAMQHFHGLGFKCLRIKRVKLYSKHSREFVARTGYSSSQDYCPFIDTANHDQPNHQNYQSQNQNHSSFHLLQNSMQQMSTEPQDTVQEDDMECIDYNTPPDIEAWNREVMERDYNLWDAVESSKWLPPDVFLILH